MFNDETIIQITSNANTLYGLSNQGRLFYWNSNLKAANAWTLVSND